MRRSGFRTWGWLAILAVAVAACADDGPGGDDGDSGLWDGPEDGPGSADGGAAAQIPGNDYCAGVVDWTEDEYAFERQVLELVNEHRAAGASCGGQPFGATGPLTMQPALHCAARVHSLDMFAREFFDHVNPDGEDPFVRMERAGYQYSAAGENIAAGQTTPQEVVDGWMRSSGHCSNIMSPDFVHIGVGYLRVESGPYPHYWTQTFGRPL